MESNSLLRLLESWQAGRQSLESLDRLLTDHYAATQTAGDVLVDIDRLQRCGFPEVVYGAGKSVDQLLGILAAQQSAGQPSLITRCDPGHAEILQGNFPDGIFSPEGRTFRRGQVIGAGTARVLVVTAGATDRAVAEEAAETARWMGCSVEVMKDVGVAGPWRLIERRQVLQQADALVVVAGMEGALPSVVAGWVQCPVIAVPTSVGYGANLQGLAPLLSMLNSCAANVAVVNIDAGFKGGYLAGMIARQSGRASAQDL